MRHGADHIYFDEQLINVGTRMVAQKAYDAYLLFVLFVRLLVCCSRPRQPIGTII